MKTNKPYIGAVLFIGLILILFPSYGKKDTITHFLNIDTIEYEKYPVIQIRGLLSPGLTGSKEKQHLISNLFIKNQNHNWKPESLDTIPLKRQLSIHLFLDINHLNRRTANKLFNAIFFGEFRNHRPYPLKNIYIPKKHMIGSTYHMPRIKRIIRVKYPPGVLHVKKLSKKDTLQERPRLVSSEIKKYIKDSILMNSQVTGEHLFIFAFEEFRQEQLKLIHFIDSLDTENHLWSSFYYETISDYFPENLSEKRVSYLGRMKIPDKKVPLESHLYELVRAIYENRIKLKFTDPFMLDTIREELGYQLSLQMDQNYYRQSISIRLPKKMAREIYTKQVISKADSLQKQNLYPHTLNYLRKRYNKTPYPLIRNKSRELFSSWSLSMKKGSCQDIDSLFNRAENRWHFTTDSLWYRKLKGNLLFSCYQSLKSRDAPLEKRMAVITRLREVINKPEIERQYHITKGLLDFEQSRFWQSAYHLKKVHPRDANLQNVLEEVLNKAFERSFQKKDHPTIYNNGLNFPDLLMSSFSMRYMFGQSCAELNNYRAATHHFEWLLNNWQNASNHKIELDTLYSRLQKLYKYAVNFKGACELDKLIFKRNQDKKDFYTYLGNLRARYLKPLIRILPYFIEKQNRHQIGDLFDEYPIRFHPFIRGIYLNNPTRDQNQILFKKEGTPAATDLALDHLLHFPAYLEGNKKKEFYLINRVNKKEFIILHLDKSLNNKESTLFSNISKNPNQLEHWRDLVNYEQSICLKILSQCIASIYETEIDLGQRGSISDYWSAWKDKEMLLYMVVHGKNGKILDNKGFKRDHARYKKHQYRKSATAMAFYQQTIRYKDQRVFDISNPIFKDNGWCAALRMGFRKD